MAEGSGHRRFRPVAGPRGARSGPSPSRMAYRARRVRNNTGGMMPVTVADRLRRSLVDLQAARADFLDLAVRQSEEPARRDLARAAEEVAEVAKALRARLRAVEAEEPEYRTRDQAPRGETGA